jgi:hypothetical protein
MPAELQQLVLRSFHRDQVPYTSTADGSLTFASRVAEGQIPLVAHCFDDFLELRTSLGPLPDEDLLRRLLEFHGHPLAGGVFFTLGYEPSGPQLLACAIMPVPETVRRAALVDQTVRAMTSRLESTHELYDSGELATLLAHGPVPPAEDVLPQTAEGVTLLARAQLTLEELLILYRVTTDQRRLTALVEADNSSFEVEIEALGVLLSFATDLGFLPKNVSAAKILDANTELRAGTTALYALAGSERGTRVRACSVTKVIPEVQTVSLLAETIQMMIADVSMLRRHYETGSLAARLQHTDDYAG